MADSKAETKTVEFSLLGRIYQLACPPAQEKRLHALAAMVEEKMRLAASSGQANLGEARLLLVAALMLADDALEGKTRQENALKAVADQASADEALLVSAVEHLTQRLSGLAEQVEAA